MRATQGLPFTDGDHVMSFRAKHHCDIFVTFHYAGWVRWCSVVRHMLSCVTDLGVACCVLHCVCSLVCCVCCVMCCVCHVLYAVCYVLCAVCYVLYAVLCVMCCMLCCVQCCWCSVQFALCCELCVQCVVCSVQCVLLLLSVRVSGCRSLRINQERLAL